MTYVLAAVPVDTGRSYNYINTCLCIGQERTELHHGPNIYRKARLPKHHLRTRAETGDVHPGRGRPLMYKTPFVFHVSSELELSLPCISEIKATRGDSSKSHRRTESRALQGRDRSSHMHLLHMPL